MLHEEGDGFPLAASGSELFIRMMTPMVREWTWARKLPALFVGHGLVDIGADVRTGLFNGGSPTAEFWRQRVEGTRHLWLRGGATEESVNELCRLLQDPSFWTFHSANISAWGRRPASEASPG